MKRSKRAGTRPVITLAAVSLVASGQLFAQTATTDQQPVQVLEEMEVTGSYIPFAADAPGIPVDILDTQALERSGVATNVLEILRKTSPQFSGSANLGSENGNISSGATNGGSQVSLRATTTLVLLDSRRVAYSPVAASGGNQFVNVNLIPPAAIESIEILKDGASATYGADAVAGVINIKLKTDFEGVQVGGRYAISDNDGNYDERSYYVVAGGKNKEKTTSVTATFSWFEQDPIFQVERPFSTPNFGTASFAGVVDYDTSGDAFIFLNPAYNSPREALAALAPTAGNDLTRDQAVALGIYEPIRNFDATSRLFNLATFPTLLISSERSSATAALEHQLTETLEVFGSIVYSETETLSQLNAQPVTGVSVAADNPNNPFNVAVSPRNRFLSNPRQYITQEQLTRAVVGLRGDISDRVSFELAGTANFVNADYANPGVVDRPLYVQRVNAGIIDPFARTQAPGALDGVFGVSTGDYSSKLFNFDARVLADVIELPGGMLKVAAGGEARRESLDFTNDPRSRISGGWLGATPQSPFSDSVSVQGLFAEARVPITGADQKIPFAHVIELSLAGRKEFYTNTDDPFVPKFGVRWQPFDEQLALRASYSESFSAPTLYDLNSGRSSGFSANVSVTQTDTNGVPTGVPQVARQYRVQNGSNPNLQPAESESWTAGFVFSPKAVKGLSFEFDWYNIEESGIVDTVGTLIILNSVERLGTASPYANLVRIGASTAGEERFAGGPDEADPVTGRGQITRNAADAIWINDTLINVGGLTQDGFDAKLTYTIQTDSAGIFTIGSSMNYLNSFKFKKLPDIPEEDFAGKFAGDGGAGQTGGTFGVLPRWRTYSYIDWSYGDWLVSVANNFTPRVEDVEANYYIEHFSTFDFAVGYTFTNTGINLLDGLKVRAGVNNAFNELVPFAPSATSSVEHSGYYGAVGRLWFIEGSYDF